MLQKELQSFEEEENKKIRGFREVIDLISASQKPVISHNSLNGVSLKWKFLNLFKHIDLVYFPQYINFLMVYADCTLVHSKFIAPLPPQVDEFISSLCTAFPKVLDLNYLMKKIGSTRKLSGIPSAISYLNNNFYAPVDLEIPDRGQSLYFKSPTF